MNARCAHTLFGAEQYEFGEVSRGLILAQALLGLGAWLCLGLPYLRRTHGLERLHPAERYLFVANHVSLLDTILLGGLCWHRGCYPILVLGDKHVWHASLIRRLLSSRIGFLLERGKLNLGRIGELQSFGRAGKSFHLVVFPEGTRGDGLQVGSFQPGLYYVAQEARLPKVRFSTTITGWPWPVYFANMQLVSTKNGAFHPVSGLRKVEVRFGEPIPAATYLPLPREEFIDFARRRVVELQPALGCAGLQSSPRILGDLGSPNRAYSTDPASSR